MTALSTFESRTAKLNGSSGDVFDFVSDLRNLGQFIPPGSVNGLVLERESCRFNISMLGDVNIRVSEKEKPDKIVLSGLVPQVDGFSLWMDIKSNGDNSSEARLILRAGINAFLKPVIAEQIKRLLESLVNEMERFRDWKKTI
ncbi:MAG: hypothetical protein ABSG89_00215 [Bacteroidales bacterium]|jgi:hypothetical protein